MKNVELELQLEVWKDLAVSNQMLIGAATDALGISSECSMDEIKDAIIKAKNHSNQADSSIDKIKKETQKAIDEVETRMAKVEQQRDEALATAQAAEKAQRAAENRINAGREANTLALKKIQLQIVEKDKALKQINKILADTPENVVKKLKTLKKQKIDESNARKKAEDEARKQKLDKQKTEQELKEMKESVKLFSGLVEQIKELKSFSESQYDQLKELVEDTSSLKKVPKLDEELLEGIEKLAASSDKDANQSSNKTGSGNGKKKTVRKKARKK